MVQFSKKRFYEEDDLESKPVTDMLAIMDRTNGLISTANENILTNAADTALLIVNTESTDFPIRVMDATGTNVLMRTNNTGDMLLAGGLTPGWTSANGTVYNLLELRSLSQLHLLLLLAPPQLTWVILMSHRGHGSSSGILTSR
jgi:hypothetical protein